MRLMEPGKKDPTPGVCSRLEIVPCLTSAVPGQPAGAQSMPRVSYCSRGGWTKSRVSTGLCGRGREEKVTGQGKGVSVHRDEVS